MTRPASSATSTRSVSVPKPGAPASGVPSKPAAAVDAGPLDHVLLFDDHDKPSNQPENRFAGKPVEQERAPDPLLGWLAEAPQKLGPIIVPSDKLPWMARSVFNPSALVKDGKIILFIRAEDRSGAGLWNGTSRIGYAESEDGVHFKIRPEPVLGPTEPYEMNGGTEDPRVVQLQDGPLKGKYLMTYTAYQFPDGMARLALAVSEDLIHWEKKGVVFERPCIEAERPEWSKSGENAVGCVGSAPM